MRLLNFFNFGLAYVFRTKCFVVGTKTYLNTLPMCNRECMKMANIEVAHVNVC